MKLMLRTRRLCQITVFWGIIIGVFNIPWDGPEIVLLHLGFTF